MSSAELEMGGQCVLFGLTYEVKSLICIALQIKNKDYSIKFRSKHSSNTVLCLLQNILEQSIRPVYFRKAKVSNKFWTKLVHFGHNLPALIYIEYMGKG